MQVAAVQDYAQVTLILLKIHNVWVSSLSRSRCVFNTSVRHTNSLEACKASLSSLQRVQRRQNLHCSALLSILLDKSPSRPETSVPELSTNLSFTLSTSSVSRFCFREDREIYNERPLFHCRPGRILLQSDKLQVFELALEKCPGSVAQCQHNDTKLTTYTEQRSFWEANGRAASQIPTPTPPPLYVIRRYTITDTMTCG
jgi:hypothetical protein